MRKTLQFIPAVAFVILFAVSTAGAAEFRGLYVDAFHPGFLTHEEVTQMVNAAKAANFNALIVQARKRGDAYYNPHVEPKASDIASGYDPLADIIQQAHAQGMEVHAWLSVYEVSHELYTNLPEAHIARAHPGWLMKDREGNTTLAGGKIYVDPGVPAVREQFVSVVDDIVTNYQVDGIHLDGARYPNRHAGYNQTSVDRFNEQFSRSGTPEDDDATWCQWRRDQVTALVSDVGSAIWSEKPAVKFSVAGVVQPATASGYFLQDYEAWTEGELVDFVVGLLYMNADKMPDYAPSVLGAAHQRHVYIGIGGFKITPQLGTKHVQDVRTAGGIGVVLFNYHYLGPNSTGATCLKLADLSSSVFAQAADIPAMPWKQ